MIELYPYQQKITNEIRESWRAGLRRVLVQSPTGSGKTVIFSWIAQMTSKQSKRILILSHRQELLQETGGTLQDFAIQPAIVSAGSTQPPRELVTVAMTLTLKNRLKNDPWMVWFRSLDLIIIDECHQQEFDYIFELIESQFVLGFTATPKRKGNQTQLAGLYQKMVSGPDVQQLINSGFLVPDKYYGVPVDISGVGRDSFGEYKTDELFSRYNRAELYAGVVDNWLRHTPGTLTIVFCVNIQHCIETARAFNQRGIRAKFVTSDVARPDQEGTKMQEFLNWQTAYTEMSGDREEVVSEWKSREFLVLINAGIFTTGFNYKPIETVIVNRATTSENLWLQMIGRGSRTSDGKTEFNLLDFGGNASRLGHYRQQREYSLTHYVSTRKDGVQSIKDCPTCGALVIASTRFCKYCGHEFLKSKKEKEVELVAQSFEELTAAQAIGSLRTIGEIEAAAVLKGYKKAWIWRSIYFKLGKQAFVDYMRMRNYQYGFIYRQIGQYGK